MAEVSFKQVLKKHLSHQLCEQVSMETIYIAFKEIIMYEFISILSSQR